LSSLCDIAVDRSIVLSIGLFGILCRSFVILLLIGQSIDRSIGLFGILCLRFVIFLSIDRSVNRAIWYSFSLLCDIADDRSVSQSGYLVFFVVAL
jgi:hypothetical protein